MTRTLVAIAALTMVALPSLAEDYLQFHDVENDVRGYWKIDQDQGLIVEVSPLNLVINDVPVSTELYAGYSIKYQREGEKITLALTSNIFEGFIEFGDGRFSPVLKSGQSKGVVLRTEDIWRTLRVAGRKPVRVKWVALEHEPADLSNSEHH